MKKHLILIVCLFCTSTVINLQAQRNPLDLPLGIDTREVPLSGSVGSANYRNGIQDNVRKKGDRDATRYLENAVKENDSERVKKLLGAGASAFISYEMLDKKQYDIIDLMYKNNPMLIRYSQLLHYACAKGDSAMVDFLIERNASLDVCGCYYEKYYSNYWGLLCRKQCNWNEDERFLNTPSDCALLKGQFSLVGYVEKKYKKSPSITGYTALFYNFLRLNLPNIIEMCLNEGISVYRGDKYVDVTKEILNHRYIEKSYHATNEYFFTYKTLLVRAIECLGEARTKMKMNNANAEKNSELAKNLESLVKLMIDKGADVNGYDEPGSAPQNIGVNVYKPSVFNTPLLAAMQYPNMLDIVKLLLEKGASKNLKVKSDGKVYNLSIEKASIRDEYKELLLIGEL